MSNENKMNTSMINDENLIPSEVLENVYQSNDGKRKNCEGDYSPNAVPVLFAPIILTPAMIPVAQAIGEIAKKWILGEALKFLKSKLFPSQDPIQNAINALRIELERKFETKLSADKQNFLLAAYKGINNLSNEFIRATEILKDAAETWHKDRNAINEDKMNQARTLVREKFTNLNDYIIGQLPQFEVPDYEEIALPLFAQVASLHLIHLKDGISKGSEWGFTSDETNFYRERFGFYISDYTKRSLDAFNRGFNRLLYQNGKGIGTAINYRSSMNVYLFDFVYNWSLLRYEAVTPSASRHLYHYIGNNNSVDNYRHTKLNTLLQIMQGMPNERADWVHLAYFMNRNADPWPITATETVYNNRNMGWVGRRSAANITPIHVFNNNPAEYENRVHGKVMYPTADRWDLAIQNNRMIRNDYLGNEHKFDIKYDNHFIRNVTSHPGSMKIEKNHNLNEDLKYGQEETKPNNIIVGFSPNHTKSFYSNKTHTIYQDKSTVISALHYDSMDYPDYNHSYFYPELGHGTDGAMITKRTNAIVRYKFTNLGESNKSIRIIIRLKAVSSPTELKINGQTFPISYLSYASNSYYDFITGPIPNQNINSLEVINLNSENGLSLQYNQLIVVHTHQFKSNLPSRSAYSVFNVDDKIKKIQNELTTTQDEVIKKELEEKINKLEIERKNILNKQDEEKQWIQDIEKNSESTCY